MIHIPVLRRPVSRPALRSAGDTTRPPPATPWRKYLEWVGVFVAYLVAGEVGLAVPFTNGNVSPVWPAAGMALASFLLFGYRVWPAIAVAAFIVNAVSPVSVSAALVVAAGNTAGPAVGAWLVSRLPRFHPSLGRLDDVLGLIGIAVPASAAISATVGVTALFLTHVDPWDRSWLAWVVWWFGDATGALLVAPLALTLLGQQRIASIRRVPELGALLSATASSYPLFASCKTYGKVTFVSA